LSAVGPRLVPPHVTVLTAMLLPACPVCTMMESPVLSVTFASVKVLPEVLSCAVPFGQRMTLLLLQLLLTDCAVLLLELTETAVLLLTDATVLLLTLTKVLLLTETLVLLLLLIEIAVLLLLESLVEIITLLLLTDRRVLLLLTETAVLLLLTDC